MTAQPSPRTISITTPSDCELSWSRRFREALTDAAQPLGRVESK